MKWCAGTLWLAFICTPSIVDAQTGSQLVDEGVAAYESGEFERAGEMLGRALSAPELSRDDVVRILTHEILVRAALGGDQLETAMLRLVSLEADGLGDSASPQLAPVFDRAIEQTSGEVIHLELEHRDRDGRLEVRARVRGDIGGLVREVRIWTRAGDAAFGDAQAGVAMIDAAPEDVQVVAEAIGPGGAVLATLGTPSEPVPLAVSAPDAAVESTNDETGLHVGITVGVIGALAVAAGIVAIVFVTTYQPESNVMGPAVEW